MCKVLKGMSNIKFLVTDIRSLEITNTQHANLQNFLVNRSYTLASSIFLSHTYKNKRIYKKETLVDNNRFT